MKNSRFALRTAREKRCFPFLITAYSACKFLDQTHAEIDGVKYAVQDFARKMEHNKISFAPA